MSPFVVLMSSFIVLMSSFVVLTSSFVVLMSPFVVLMSSFAVQIVSWVLDIHHFYMQAMCGGQSTHKCRTYRFLTSVRLYGETTNNFIAKWKQLIWNECLCMELYVYALLFGMCNKTSLMIVKWQKGHVNQISINIKSHTY